MLQPAAPLPSSQLLAPALLLAVLGLVAAPGLAGAAPVPLPVPGAATDVVVRAAPAVVDEVIASVERQGGRLERRLPVIDGFSAQVPAAALDRLRQQPGVLAVTPDGPVRMRAVDPSLGHDPTSDLGSLHQVTRVAKVHEAWRAGWTGKGVDVAMIDSGVSPVPGLTSGNVVDGPDLSFESQDAATTRLDTFGHGTHMAGIIAGRDVAGPPSSYTSPHRFTGVAPDARLVSLKVAAGDGATDVSQVIAAIGWVTEHAQDPGLDIRVLNLSYGTDSTQDPRLDPLAHAAEAAWRRGIVVVAAGGNDGTDIKTLSNPAVSPAVLAVGAQDPRGTVGTSDDEVPDFASRGTAARHVDLVAPAVHVLSLTAPGSWIDAANPQGKVGTRFLRGSGTSQAAAVTSGAAALYLQKHPTATPDQVKRALVLGATPFPGASELHRGAGALNVGAALGIAPRTPSQSGPPASTGTGSLEAARGSAHVSDAGVELVGEQDILGNPFDGEVWGPLASQGRTWSGGSWNGNPWTGGGWTDTTWAGPAWAGRTWTGDTWAGDTWTGRTWTGDTWTGRTWTGRTWTGRTWTGRTWTGGVWAGVRWR